MKSAVIDVNVFLDLIKLQMLAWLFKIGFQVYTTQEMIDQLNENQSEFLMEFIVSAVTSDKIAELFQSAINKVLDATTFFILLRSCASSNTDFGCELSLAATGQ